MPSRPHLSERKVRLLGTGASLPATAPIGRRSSPPDRTVVSTAGSGATRVLGLDLAISTTGWCLLVGGVPEAHGSFTLPDRARRESDASWLSRRASELGRHVELLAAVHRPEIVGFEVIDETRPSWSGGSKGREMVVSQALGRAQGMLVALWPRIGNGARLVTVPVSQAKRLVTGRSGATKDQVAWALRTYHGFDLQGWTPDETDAAAIALAAREDGLR